MTAVAVVLGLVGWYQRPNRRGYVLMASGAILFDPLLGIGVTAAFVLAKRWRAIADERAEARDRHHEVLAALDLVALGTTAGLPFNAAVSLASREIAGPMADVLDRAVARTGSGLSHALEDGPFARAFDAAQRSAATGAPLGDSLVDLAKEVRSDEAAAERERIERLPVKLLFPLAFLILPGFVLVAVVPSIVSGMSQLNF